MVLLRYVFPGTSFYDLFCNMLKTISVFLVITLIYGEVKAKTSIYLNVNKPWAGGRQVGDREWWCY